MSTMVHPLRDATQPIITHQHPPPTHLPTSPQQANGRGYWETDEENLELLRELYEEVEDRIEGL